MLRQPRYRIPRGRSTMKRLRLLLCGALLLCGCRAGDTMGGRRGAAEGAGAHAATSTSVTLAAVGDILLDRGVGQEIRRRGMGYSFEPITGLLSAADVTFGNLECPLSEKGTKVTKRYCFQARPETAECLVRGGFDLLSLANNHTMDCGRTGLVETMQSLEEKSLRWCGAGHSRAEAEAATVLTVKGLRIAFVGFSEFLPEGSFLRDDRPTIAFASEESVRRSIAAARPQADIVVASFHWGIEYESRPDSRQVMLAREAVRAGADLVLGHHPHVLQGLEVVSRDASASPRRSLIAYSLGNFLFDRRSGATLQSAVLRCTLNRNGLAAAEIIPVQLDGIRPHLAGPAEAAPILARLTDLSAERETRITLGRVELGDADVKAPR